MPTDDVSLQLTITTPFHLELVRVPAGKFWMGNDPAKGGGPRKNEEPQHTVELPEFAIGKYPITNAQYASFAQATGHRTPWKNDEMPSGKEDHPVDSVPWEDAVVFCNWLSQETGREFRLPSEAEWEKAARGTDGRIYPWGDEPPMADLCNYGRKVGDTTPVGAYSPESDSPYGCADMAGNVWEWTRSLWGTKLTYPDFGYPYYPKDGRENLEAGFSVWRVRRGGSFDFHTIGVRCTARQCGHLGPLGGHTGFRVVISPLPVDSDPSGV